MRERVWCVMGRSPPSGTHSARDTLHPEVEVADSQKHSGSISWKAEFKVKIYICAGCGSRMAVKSEAEPPALCTDCRSAEGPNGNGY